MNEANREKGRLVEVLGFQRPVIVPGNCGAVKYYEFAEFDNVS